MDPKFTDKILICVKCREEFVFTVSAQEYFAQRGYTEDPKRCKSCYMELKRKTRKRGDREVVDQELEMEISEEEPSGNGGNSALGNGNGGRPTNLR